MDELNEMLNNMLDDDSVVILFTDLSKDINDILKSKCSDEILIENIENFYETDLKPQDVEIFEKYDNIYVTNEGYYLAVYLDDVNELINDDMNEKLKNVNLVDELDATFTDVKNQLTDDEKRWGDTWKERGLIHDGVDQETRWFEKMREYYEQYEEWGTPIPWEKVIGEAHIALVREKANK